MTYEDVLRHLHRVLGQRVSVHIGGAHDQAPALLAAMHGTLQRGTRLGEAQALSDHESMVFDVGDASFVIARNDIVSAELIAGDPHLLQVTLGCCELQVSTLAGARPHPQ